MPRFYFDVHDGKDSKDDEGIECADLGAARTEALRAAGDMLKEQTVELWNGTPWTMEVRDESNKIVALLKFNAV